MAFIDTFKKKYIIFDAKDDYERPYDSVSYSLRPDRPKITGLKERTIITSIINRIAIDCSAIEMKHIRLDTNGRYKEDVQSTLNTCFGIEANRDQSAFAFKLDTFISLLDEGCIAVVPYVTDENIKSSRPYQIHELRTGKILEWYPDSIKVRVYNEINGKQQEVIVKKNKVAIIENPLYQVMNEQNSTLQRLIRKLSMLDAVDEQSSSGKLDLLIQLPYSLKTQARREEANKRRGEIEDQLYGSKYGIAYIDSTERVTQLNRPIDNNLMKQIEYLTSMLYGQLGMSQAVLDGTANESEMLNYYNRTIDPILTAVTNEYSRKFLTDDERADGETIKFFRDPFKFVTMDKFAELSDKLTRNAIVSSNEVRQAMFLKPSDDPSADELRNKNLNDPNPGNKEEFKTGNEPNVLDSLELE